jgi:shikimate kinase
VAGAQRDRVLLVGMMGAGKSSVGKALEDLLGWRYVDNDELVARAAGKDTRRVLDEDGVAALRRAESLALHLALTDGGPLVAGVAGGVVTDPLDAAQLRDGGFVVWLRAEPSLLLSRVTGTPRPWLGDQPEAAMRRLAAGRGPLYAAVASLILDTDHGSPYQHARRIAAALL